MENALVPSDEQSQKMLAAATGEMMPSRLPPIPEIRMFNVKAQETIEGVGLGEFYIQEISYNPEKNERTKKYTPLAEDEEFVIIKKRSTYSYYDKEADRLTAWTNEIDPMDRKQSVHIIFNDGHDVSVAATMSQREFKNLRSNAKAKKTAMQPMSRLEMIAMNLKFKNVVYMYSPSRAMGYKMFVTNASTTGVPDGAAKYGSYDDPQQGSLVEFQNKLTANEPFVLFKATCKLGSREKKDTNGQTDYFLMTFKIGKELDPETFQKMLFKWAELTKELAIRDEQEISKLESSVDTKAKNPNVMTVSDLPDFEEA